jgi:hypothetical protein
MQMQLQLKLKLLAMTLVWTTKLPTWLKRTTKMVTWLLGTTNVLLARTTKLEVTRGVMRPTTLVMMVVVGKRGKRVLIMNGFRMYKRMYRFVTQNLITSVVDAHKKYVVVRVCDAQQLIATCAILLGIMIA